MQHNGSNIMAGGTAAFVATGNGTPGSGNVTIAGSNVNASDVVLAANNQVNLVNSTDTDSSRNANESKSGSIAVSYGSQGYGISAAGSRAHGNANSDSTAQNNTHIQGANSVSIVSGGDTNIKGATVDGGQVSALVGGDLNIASVQDTSRSAAHQDSQSAGVSISQAGSSASYSTQHGNAHGDYAGVEEQSGIHAGAGGFDINVKGNTDLHGGYIASDADASKNTLTTGTLTFGDITNTSNFEASSSGFSVGGSMGATTSAKANGVTSLTNGGGISPLVPQNDSGHETATTRSAISAGTINVTDGANQKQDVASLSRDTNDTNGTVSKLPDLSNLLSQQAAAIVAQTVATQIGNYAERKEQEAKDAGDPATAEKWAEGGEYRIAMHIAGGAAVAGLGGGSIGSAAQGAAGAGVSAAAAGHLNELSHDIAASSPTGNVDADRALGNIIANVIATGAGAAVGGGSGAAAASAVDMYNGQNHRSKPDERPGHENTAGNDINDNHLNILPTAGGAISTDANPDTFTVGGGTALPAAGIPRDTQPDKVTVGPSQQAQAWQGSGAYPGVDKYTDVTLSRGTFVIGAAPGQSAYYTSLSGFNGTDGSTRSYDQALQIQPNLTNPAYPAYRNGVTVDSVNSNTSAAYSAATLANPQHRVGGAPQLSVPDFKTSLTPIFSIPFKK